VLEEEYLDTLTSMANLAYIWKSQCRDEEAIELLKRAKDCKNRSSGLITISPFVLYKFCTNGKYHQKQSLQNTGSHKKLKISSE
jgi:hypothetical protein